MQMVKQKDTGRYIIGNYNPPKPHKPLAILTTHCNSCNPGSTVGRYKVPTRKAPICCNQSSFIQYDADIKYPARYYGYPIYFNNLPISLK